MYRLRSLRWLVPLLGLGITVVLAGCGTVTGPSAPATTPPSISSIQDQRVLVGGSLNVAFTVTDADPASVKVTASAADTSLVPSGGLVLSGSGQARVLTITPDPTAQGTTKVTIDATDKAGKTASASFTLTVALPFTGSFPQLTTGNSVVDAHLGYSVGVSGSYAVMGNPFTGTSGTTGSAAVFQYKSGAWTFMAELPASGISDGAYFGESVAISGNYIVVGAPWPGGGGPGYAYVFELENGTWTQVAELTGNNSAWGDDFGWSVAIDGTTVVAGAILHNGSAGTASGAAYVFQPSSGVWGQVASLDALDAAAGDQFGASVAVSGSTVLVGANLHSGTGGTNSGAAYIFQDNASTWSQVAELAPNKPSAYENFGISVGLDGTHAIVGADGNGSLGANTGAAYIFDGSSSGWLQVAQLAASDATANSYFGHAVAIRGNYALVGAYDRSQTQPSSVYGVGAAYVYQLDSGSWVQKTRLVNPNPTPSSQFGWSVDLSDNFAAIAFGYVFQK